MALETIEQILSPERAPSINGVKAGLKVSPAILENVYQGLVEKDGRGVNDKWVSESDANENAQILVNRVLPINMKARVQGAGIRGRKGAEGYRHTTERRERSTVLQGGGYGEIHHRSLNRLQRDIQAEEDAGGEIPRMLHNSLQER